MLINQAAHCTGPAAVQLAKALGGRVIATCDTSEDRDYLRELGAETVIVTEEEDLVGRLQKLTEGRGVEVVLDACGGSQMKLLGDVMAPLGKLILYGMNGGNETACRCVRPSRRTSNSSCIAFATSLGSRSWASSRTARPSNALQHINQLTVDRTVRPQVDRQFPFEQAIEAHRYVESGIPRGRVVLTLS